MNQEYTFQNHVHNYAVWTAARAVQRGFTTTKLIKESIDYAHLKEFAEAKQCATQDEFDKFHKSSARRVIEQFNSVAERLGAAKMTYGRAAKIIAVYLKTSIIIPSGGQTTLATLIHPPIDRILLTNLAKKHKLRKLCANSWTSLDENEYWELHRQILDIGLPFIDA